MRISSTYDKQGGESYKDRYWGDVPMFLKYIPEQQICVPNTDFIDLVNGLMENKLDNTKGIKPVNVSRILMKDLEIILEIMADPVKACMVDPKYSLIVKVVNGDPNPCLGSTKYKVDCSEKVCCHAKFRCSAI